MKNELLQHTLSTIKYRFEKSVVNSTEEFGEFSLGNGSRTTVEIINHMYHVLYSARIFLGEEVTSTEQPKTLNLLKEIERFNVELMRISKALSEEDLSMNYAKRLLQGPFSDILTHIGQISMLQRLNGKPIQREDFSAAAIKTGVN